uniref:Uncharacterized protein n=1 Tax=Clandestinovirus TaxID=2831644 RepID=A0A8F8KPD2_9VIRU|nr:hypothetical protein KOM_12_553 [Clandestinovirus]
MSNAKFVEVAKAKVMTTEEMFMRSQRPYACWSDKDDYCFTLRLANGDIKIGDEVWAETSALIPPNELKRINGTKVYLGSVDKINLRYDDMPSMYAKPSDETETNEAVTVNVVFESIKHPHYPLSVIFDKWMCINLLIFRSSS